MQNNHCLLLKTFKKYLKCPPLSLTRRERKRPVSTRTRPPPQRASPGRRRRETRPGCWRTRQTWRAGGPSRPWSRASCRRGRAACRRRPPWSGGGRRASRTWRRGGGRGGSGWGWPRPGWTVRLRSAWQKFLTVLGGFSARNYKKKHFEIWHFRYFWIFSIIKNDFIAFFIKLITYFCINPI